MEGTSSETVVAGNLPGVRMKNLGTPPLDGPRNAIHVTVVLFLQARTD